LSSNCGVGCFADVEFFIEPTANFTGGWQLTTQHLLQIDFPGLNLFLDFLYRITKVLLQYLEVSSTNWLLLGSI
jgi:hypothetical protein